MTNKLNYTQSFRRLSQKMPKSWHNTFEVQDNHYKLLKKIYGNNGLVIQRTSCMCPEQYEIFRDGIQVAYYRLRHGEFRIDMPDHNGETLCEYWPYGDGAFGDDERMAYLVTAMRKVLAKLTTP